MKRLDTPVLAAFLQSVWSVDSGLPQAGAGVDEQRGPTYLRLFLGPLAPEIQGCRIHAVKTGEFSAAKSLAMLLHATTASIIHPAPCKLRSEEGGSDGDAGLWCLHWVFCPMWDVAASPPQAFEGVLWLGVPQLPPAL